MKRNTVTSSNIASVGYDEPTKTLEIEFHNGQIWQYEPVTLDGYNQLMGADSIGSHFYKHIRNNETLRATKQN